MWLLGLRDFEKGTLMLPLVFFRCRLDRLILVGGPAAAVPPPLRNKSAHFLSEIILVSDSRPVFLADSSETQRGPVLG